VIERTIMARRGGPKTKGKGKLLEYILEPCGSSERNGFVGIGIGCLVTDFINGTLGDGGWS
jgi:hypothetical protein